MKYRRLRPEELQELETEFVRFLAVQSITASDWEKMKQEQPDRVNEIVDQFSDVVFEKTIANVEYLQFNTVNDIKAFHLQPEKIVMMGLYVEGKTEVDFRNEFSREMLLELGRNADAQLKLYTAEKKYKTTREEEIFKMLESGCRISKEGTVFKQLASLREG